MVQEKDCKFHVGENKKWRRELQKGKENKSYRCLDKRYAFNNHFLIYSTNQPGEG